MWMDMQNMVRLGYMSRDTALRQMELEEKNDCCPEMMSILKDELKIPDNLIDKFMSYTENRIQADNRDR